jgi:hypothetical protein
MNFITGEQIQELADIYLGNPGDFRFNPRILRQVTKCLSIGSISKPWSNPGILFVYGHRVSDFMNILEFVENPFVLITHNSDENITEKYLKILDHPKLIRWHSQNPMLRHEKLHLLPIGIANSMWKHGNLATLKKIIDKKNSKTKDIYFYFNVSTNVSERNECKKIIEKNLIFEQPKANFEEYLDHLSRFKYAICPPGNGIDSHRIWECLYLGVIPIVKRSVFTEVLSEYCILLDNWSDFDMGILEKYSGPRYYDISMDTLISQDLKLSISR